MRASAGSETHDPGCIRCPRLAAYLREIREQHPDYHARPVPAFGASAPHLLVVGLAPGLHGANRTGRPFTGDFAGDLLYRTLHAFGFANRPASRDAQDGLVLTDCRIINAVKCVPPKNRPTGPEVGNCNPYLVAELRRLPAGAVILALGTLAHGAILKALGLKRASHPFGHASEHALPGGRRLLDSYHCSRYNTQTRRLSEAMFRDVIHRARALQSG